MVKLCNAVTAQVVEFEDEAGADGFLAGIGDPENWERVDEIAARPPDAEPMLEGSTRQPSAYCDLVVPLGMGIEEMPHAVHAATEVPGPGYRLVELAEVVVLAFRASELKAVDWNLDVDRREAMIAQQLETLRALAATRPGREAT